MGHTLVGAESEKMNKEVTANEDARLGYQLIKEADGGRDRVIVSSAMALSRSPRSRA